MRNVWTLVCVATVWCLCQFWAARCAAVAMTPLRQPPCECVAWRVALIVSFAARVVLAPRPEAPWPAAGQPPPTQAGQQKLQRQHTSSALGTARPEKIVDQQDCFCVSSVKNKVAAKAQIQNSSACPARHSRKPYAAHAGLLCSATALVRQPTGKQPWSKSGSCSFSQQGAFCQPQAGGGA
jgi:hypothetical protein